MSFRCRGCLSVDHKVILDLGNHSLSDFKNDFEKPKSFPLVLVKCSTCNLAQLSLTVSRELMYSDSYGYRSSVNEMIRTNLLNIVKKSNQLNSNAKNWLDIACNDGTLLSYVSPSLYRVGVDPVLKFREESSKYANLIISDFFPTDKIKDELKFDIISTISMFYDIDEPREFIKHIKNLLQSRGIWVVQQNYLLDMLRKNSYDNICHEHLTYYSLRTFKSILNDFDLDIFELFRDDINGGSLCTFICHKGDYDISDNVHTLAEEELEFGLNSEEVYLEFADRVKILTKSLNNLLVELKDLDKKVFIYGASTRGSTIWQASGMNSDLISYAVERQESKVGKIYSALGIPIISEAEMRSLKPDFLLIGPWYLSPAFAIREEKYLSEGGKFIIPLPEIKIFEAKANY
jgi:NDP-4-keto-2,6-dideoxyhexose 3-C-methyltransferase